MLGEMGSSGFESKSSHHTEGGLHPPLPVLTPLNKVIYCNKQLPQLSQAVLPCRGTVSADKQECSRTGRKSKLPGFLHPANFGTQTQQPVETGPGPEHLEHLFEHRVVQNGDPRDNKNLPTGRGVGHIHRLKTHTSIYQFTVSPGSTCVFISRVGPTSSKPYPLVYPQLQWSSQWWPRRSNSWHFRGV